ncbi:YihA2, YihA/EngB-like GTPase [Tribonema minus]|uniref:YihA2, YihA/EngB-like GTPase n=1 Tax=Tribonema minus TaxID=303371 RepID=A0A835YYM3_9STRA|nr:YihA2, YihA/EngB-like GTPase [Tribonema minus]
MPTKSPWVWTMKGMDADSAVHRTDPDIARGCRAMQAGFFPPNLFKFDLPKAGVPEVAFCGRSNVGKSTLVGTLINNTKLVRASKEPGCTRTVNYFGLTAPTRIKKGSEVDRAAVYMVDLPGYGFAKAPVQEVQAWTAAVEGFIVNRDCALLRRTFVLIDGRHGVKQHDEDMMTLLDDHGVSYQIVLTKADQLTKRDIAVVVEGVMRAAARHAACYPVVHVVSARDGHGVLQLLDTIYYVTGLANANNFAIQEADI